MCPRVQLVDMDILSSPGAGSSSDVNGCCPTWGNALATVSAMQLLLALVGRDFL